MTKTDTWRPNLCHHPSPLQKTPPPPSIHPKALTLFSPKLPPPPLQPKAPPPSFQPKPPLPLSTPKPPPPSTPKLPPPPSTPKPPPPSNPNLPPSIHPKAPPHLPPQSSTPPLHPIFQTSHEPLYPRSDPAVSVSQTGSLDGRTDSTVSE
ncbi:hypothetical protein Pcinc_020831 [Petrolisthes cinctipes]|uniref:Uncharacterized protein n=1 Tax=Petrolisthes cinctipes TaxID=88211 RepID=A0AAE1FID6_PETCI|nr:hypothetical protein Pcinc_020831 [Petrolisthes cinctipes]